MERPLEEELATLEWHGSHPHSKYFAHLMPGFYGTHNCSKDSYGDREFNAANPADILWFLRHLKEAASRGRT